MKGKEKADDFTRGYLCALNQIYRGHGGSGIIDEVLRAAAAENIDPMSIDELDREMLIKYQKDGVT